MPQPNLREATNAPEPLLPIEKKLIGWSLGVGIALLAVLLVINWFAPIG
jgi:cell division septal protein FtsQ